MESHDLSLIYFYSTTCPHCKAVEPTVIALSKEMSIQGVVFGKGVPAPMPFTVQKGDKSALRKYSLEGVPALVVLQKETVRHIFRGEHNIRASRLFLRGLAKGALTVTEAVSRGQQKDVILTGWIEGVGEYFKDKQFIFTDRKKSIMIRPWLPLEAVRSPVGNKRPRLMSDVMDKAVALRGELQMNDGTFYFTVKEELNLESQ